MVLHLEGPLSDRSGWQAESCSVARAMDVIGSRSAMLLLREAFYGTTRFDDFAARVGITDAVAASRLKQLVNAGIFEKRPYREPGARTRSEYILTEMGRDLFPVVLALMQWGDKHLQSGSAGPLDVVDRPGGKRVDLSPRDVSGARVPLEGLAVRVNRDWLARGSRE